MRSPSPPSTVSDTGPAVRFVALVLILVGALGMLVAVFADSLGVGGATGFGWKQLIAAIAGLVLLLVGLAWLLQPPGGSDPPNEPLEPLD